MAHRFLLISMMLTMATLAACSDRKQQVSNAKIDELRRMMPGVSEACWDKVRYGGIEAFPSQVDACYAMTAPAVWRGLWRNAFEGSRFCPEPAKECSTKTPGDIVWLTKPENGRLAKLPPLGDLYRIEFVGRRTAVRSPQGHGHLGFAQHEIVVDRLISLIPAN